MPVMHELTVLEFEAQGVALVVRRQRDKRTWRCGSAFCITPIDGAAGSGSWYLVYLRKTEHLSGTDVLDVAERCCRALGGTRLSLQDQATMNCGEAGQQQQQQQPQYDVAFRSQLLTGRTWYERKGYVVSEGSHHVRSVRRWLEAYRRIPVRSLRLAVEKQVARLADAEDYRRNGGQRWEPMEEIVPLVHAFTSARDESPHPTQFLESELPWLLWHRRRLLRLLRSAPEGSTLGTWLPTLPCSEYAHFMMDTYGALRDGRSPAILGYDRAGGETPSVKEFIHANAVRRWAHKITFTKDV
jgi:hypothetical protein